MSYKPEHIAESQTLKFTSEASHQGDASRMLMDLAYARDAVVQARSDEYQKLERQYGSHTSIHRNIPHIYEAAHPENAGAIATIKQEIRDGITPKLAFETSQGINAIGVEQAHHFVASQQVELDEAYKRFDRSLAGFEEKFFGSPEGKKFQSYLQNPGLGNFTEFLPPDQQEALKKTEARLEKKAGQVFSGAKEWSGGKKLAVAGAITALVAVIGGWVWKAKHRDKEKLAEQTQGAAR